MKPTLFSRKGLSLSYVDLGDRKGYPILTQHGLIASIEDSGLFDSLIRANVRVICIARPGYGQSTPYLLKSYAEWADLVSPLVKELDLSRFDVLGMSSGAPFAYALAWKYPRGLRNIYIFSGTPALYDKSVLAQWPYPSIKDHSIEALEVLAKELFFSWVKPDDLKNNDIRDSMMNDCFGVAQDLRLRFMDWGFSLADIQQKVFMRHSRTDDSVPYGTALRTAELLPNCSLELSESGPHFSLEALDDFIKKTIIKNLP